MSDTELQFRTSTFGGFQKQDVLNYIETSNQEHREKLEAVRRELAEAEAAKAAQAEEIAAAQAQTEAKEKELQALREELAAALARQYGPVQGQLAYEHLGLTPNGRPQPAPEADQLSLLEDE